MDIKTLDSKDNGRVFGLIAGSPGVGKTTQATTFPQKETLIISLEDGMLSLAGSGYAYAECDSYKDLLDAVTDVPKWVKYLYIDSLTEVYDLLKKELDSKFTSSQNFGKHEQMDLMLFHLIRQARKLSIDTFFTCHVKRIKDGLDVIDDLAFDGKMPEMVKKQFDMVLHLQADVDDEGNNERFFITSPELSKIAKKRVSPWLNIEVKDKEEANLYKLTNKLKGLN